MLLRILLLMLLCCICPGWADSGQARRYQDVGMPMVMAWDAALLRFVMAGERENELQIQSERGKEEIRVEGVQVIARVLLLKDGSCLMCGTDAAGKTRFYLYREGWCLQELRSEGVPAWCMPMMEVADGAESSLLALGGDQPMGAAPVYRLQVKDGVVRAHLLYPNRERAVSWAFTPAGEPLATLRWDAKGGKHVDSWLGGRGPHPVFSAAASERLQLLGIADEKHVYVMHDRGLEGAGLGRLHLETGELTTIASADRADIVHFLLAPHGELLGYSDRWGTDEYTAVKACPAWNAVCREVAAEAAVTPLAVSSCGRRLLLLMQEGGAPASYALWEQGKGCRILVAPQNLPPVRKTHFAEYQAADGTSIPVYYTLPEGEGPFPTVVFVHGGPRMRTDASYDWRVQYLVSQGFAVVQPQFRGSRGWGKSFMHAGNRQWGTGVMQTDVNDCIPWLQEQGIAEPGRIAIFGGSYGGYAATAALCFYPGTYACGISLFGPQDLLLHLQKMNAAESPYAGEDNLVIGNQDDPAERARLRAVSPALHAHKFQDPLLLYYGEKDTLIPPEHSKLLAKNLRVAGKQVKVLSLPDEAHGFLNPEHEPWLYAEHIVPFLRQHLNFSPSKTK